MDQILAAFTRRKKVDDETVGESQLARVLTVFDLTALGVGATLGAGVYVLTGAVAKETSGPSVVISFLIAALTSVLAGLCYAEFGARVPKAGSGYVYSYVTVGELCAFVIGWNLILSYVIGTASVARAWTANLDALLGKQIETYMKDCCSMDVNGLSPYPDLFSFVVILVLTALIAFGVKEFATVNKMFTVLNICVILFVVIAGLTQADIHNWSWTFEEITDLLASQRALTSNGTYNMTTAASNYTYTEAPTMVEHLKKLVGTGGFLPFGFSGLISGTATCFYAFVGFDCIATTGEEAINPQRSIPLGIVFSLAICCIAYLGISSTLTLMQPYFLLDKDAPLPYAFDYVNMTWARYPVSVGAICALSTSLLGAMFPMPRIIYAMAIDGLLFKFLASVHKKTKTPLIATFVSGVFAGIMAVFFDLKELVDLMSIGTLAAYTLVAASVLLLRYQPDPDADIPAKTSDDDFIEKKEMLSSDVESRESLSVSLLFRPASSLPTAASSTIVNWSLALSALAMTAFSVVAIVAPTVEWNAGSIAFVIIFGIGVVGSSTVIACQPQSSKSLSFKVPLVPLVPILNMFVNIYLMVSLPPSTWYKLLVWLAAGGLIYMVYGVRHSAEDPRNVKEQKKNESLKDLNRTSHGQDEQLIHETGQV